jgi:hypothetical protein
MRKLIISIPEDNWNVNTREKVEALKPYVSIDKVPAFSGSAIFGIVLIVVYLSMLASFFIFGTYQDGQIDALSGKDVQYQLVMEPDSTKHWEHK